MMENATCNVIYVDKRAKDVTVQRDSFANQSDDVDSTLRATLTSVLSIFPSGRLSLAFIHYFILIDPFSSTILDWLIMSV
jgi:hypothetical protein